MVSFNLPAAATYEPYRPMVTPPAGLFSIPDQVTLNDAMQKAAMLEQRRLYNQRQQQQVDQHQKAMELGAQLSEKYGSGQDVDMTSLMDAYRNNQLALGDLAGAARTEMDKQRYLQDLNKRERPTLMNTAQGIYQLTPTETGYDPSLLIPAVRQPKQPGVTWMTAPDGQVRPVPNDMTTLNELINQGWSKPSSSKEDPIMERIKAYLGEGEESARPAGVNPQERFRPIVQEESGGLGAWLSGLLGSTPTVSESQPSVVVVRKKQNG